MAYDGLKREMDATAELGRNSVSKHHIQFNHKDGQADGGRGLLPNRSREIKFSGAKGDREIFIFPVSLTTCRIGNLTRLILTLAIYVTIPTRRNRPFLCIVENRNVRSASRSQFSISL